MKNCLFCRIVAKEIPSKLIYEDDHSLAFEDIHPQAPVHLLLIPKKHIETLLEIQAEDLPLLMHLMELVAKLAREHGLAKSGFRTVINTRSHGGQTVYHLHLHLIGGRQMTWPPG